MRKVKKPSESRGRVRFLDENERKNLLEECENSPNIFFKITTLLKFNQQIPPMKAIKVTELKKYLMSRTQEEMVNEVTELFQMIKEVKQYYTMKLDTQGAQQVLETYKNIITHEFFPNRGFGKARLSVAKKAISDFKKLSDSPLNNADIMLHYVENGVQFTEFYGDIDENFYTSMENMFDDAVKYILKYKLLESYEDRCKDIIYRATDGWGFQDTLKEIYESNLELWRVNH